MSEAAPGPKANGLADAERGETAAPPKQASSHALKPFVVVSSSYLLYTITDGAIRMIVLLHAYNNGFSAMEVATLFTLYEVAGVVTNLLAGIAGSRWGIQRTLVFGLVLQLVGILMLYGWRDAWTKAEAIAYVTASQMLCGIAKDLTKLGGKTVAKLVTPDEKQSYLFKLVAFITGFKNSLKGAGYFLGAATVSWSYNGALGILLGLIGLALPGSIFLLESDLGKSTGKKKVTLNDVFRMNYNINVLSASRLFLFGSRDAWFEVPLPFFLRDQVSGLGWDPKLTGAFLAIFIIVYGQVQSWSPHLLLTPLKQAPANKYVALLWASVLLLVPTLLGPIILASDAFADRDTGAMTGILVAFLALFCFVFAVNSAVHSYLVLRYSDGNKVAVNVGFYYMSNAAGRLTGTVLSGVLYSYAGATRADGFGWCFILSAAFGLLCAAITTAIRDNDAGLSCGSWTCVHGTEPADDREKEGEGREEGVVVVAPVAVEMRRGNGGSLDAGEVDGRAGLRWRDDERVDEVRQRDSTVFLAEERPAFLDWDGSEHAEAGDVRWHGRFGRTGHLSFPGTGPPEVPLEACGAEIRAKSHSADAAILRPYVNANDTDSLPLAAAQAEAVASGCTAAAADAHLQPQSSPAAPADDTCASSDIVSGTLSGATVAPLSTPATSGAPAAGPRPKRLQLCAPDTPTVGEEGSDSLQLGGPRVAAEVLASSGGVDSSSDRAIRLDTIAARTASVTPRTRSTGSVTLRYYAPSPSPGASPLAGRDHSAGGASAGLPSSTNDSSRTAGADNTTSPSETAAASPVWLVPAMDDGGRGDAAAPGRFSRSFSPVNGLSPGARRRGGEPPADGARRGEQVGDSTSKGWGNGAVTPTSVTSDTASGDGAPWEDDRGPQRHIYQPLSDATAAGAIAEAPPLLPFVPDDMFQRQRKPQGGVDVLP